MPADTKSDNPSEKSRITVSGTARIYGDWACEGVAEVRATPGGTSEPLTGFPDGLRVANVIMPVSAFECNDSNVRNRFRQALKKEEQPEITFDMYSYNLKNGDGDAQANGEFTIAGVTKDVELDAKIAPLE